MTIQMSAAARSAADRFPDGLGGLEHYDVHQRARERRAFHEDRRSDLEARP